MLRNVQNSKINILCIMYKRGAWKHRIRLQKAVVGNCHCEVGSFPSQIESIVCKLFKIEEQLFFGYVLLHYFDLTKLQLKRFDCLRKLMASLLSEKLNAKIGFKSSNRDNGQVHRKRSMVNNCRLYWGKKNRLNHST